MINTQVKNAIDIKEMTLSVKIGKDVRNLPIVKTASGAVIAGLDTVGDMELIKNAALDLCLMTPSDELYYIDFIITTEVKGIPIAQQTAYNLNMDYICLRKEPKVYMGKTVKFEGRSITSGKQDYYLSEKDAERLKGKNILFVDDVFSTGSTFDTIKKVCDKVGCTLKGGLFIAREVDVDRVPYACTTWEYKGIKCQAVAVLPLLSDEYLV